MCGRYTVDTSDSDIRLIAKQLADDLAPYKSGEVFPSDGALTVAGDGARLAPKVMKWGFQSGDGAPVINGRAETLRIRRMFAESFNKRRCVAVTTGFYEWDAEKQKFLFRLSGGGALYLGALWTGAPGSERFIVITAPANESVMPVHSRMPLVIPKEHVRDWISDTYAAAEMLSSPLPMLERTAV